MRITLMTASQNNVIIEIKIDKEYELSILQQLEGTLDVKNWLAIATIKGDKIRLEFDELKLER